VLMEEESFQKINGSGARHHCDVPSKEELPEDHPSGGRRSERDGLRWTVWLLVILIVLLFASSLANIVMSQRAHESYLRQVNAIEQLTQSIKDVQRSVANLSKMLEQASPEDEELEEDRAGGPSGGGSI